MSNYLAVYRVDGVALDTTGGLLQSKNLKEE